jgi:hypothetical protein
MMPDHLQNFSRTLPGQHNCAPPVWGISAGPGVTLERILCCQRRSCGIACWGAGLGMTIATG